MVSVPARPARFTLYKLMKAERYLLIDHARAPTLGDLVAVQKGGRVWLATYHGQPVLGVAYLLENYRLKRRDYAACPPPPIFGDKLL
jgi:hypothetical protein